MAAYGVIANISLVVTAVYTGISQGIQPLVSTAHGQDRPGLIRQYLRYALITLLVLSAALYLLLFLFAGPVALIFNSEGTPGSSRSPKRACGSISPARSLPGSTSSCQCISPRWSGPCLPISPPCCGVSS